MPGLLAKQQTVQEAAWARFKTQHPRQAKRLQPKVTMAATHARTREMIRSEVVRLFAVARCFALRAGVLTNLSERIFFLSHQEMVALLRGEDSAVSAIPARQETYARYTALPPYPMWINGRFDPFTWAKDSHPRSDLFDAAQPALPAASATTITGYAGAAGIVEGIIRRLDTPDEGHLLQTGEILLTNTTNIGWTPLFPHAAAIITDVGAPLSHTAIVARELGISAVVGCGNATMRLKTGDRVRVNGGNGTVEILESRQV